MKTIRAASGPFVERPYFESVEIDRICIEALRRTGLYPSEPGPIRIDRFIEKRFDVTPSYASDIPDGVLGYTEFGKDGVAAIVISRTLAEEGGQVADRRVRATMAHEAGHGLLHAHLFALEYSTGSLFNTASCSGRQILCREVLIDDVSLRRQKPSWSEYQANAAIGGLLLPRKLVDQALSPYKIAVGLMGEQLLAPEKRETAIRFVADLFDVNPIVARIRLDSLYGLENGGQMPL